MLQTLTANTVAVVSGSWTNGGMPTTQNSYGVGNNKLRYDFPTFVLPAGAQVRSVTLKATLGTGAVSQGILWNLFEAGVAGPVSTFGNNQSSTPVTITSTLRPNGTAWNQTAIDGVQAEFFANDSSAGSLIYAVSIDVVYNVAPVGTPTGPTGTQTLTDIPALTHTFSDGDGDLQESVRWKVFSLAQYGASGFDPNISVPTYDKTINGVATSHIPETALLNGGTYRAWPFVADVGSGGRTNIVSSAGQSGYTQFSIALDKPAVPILVAGTLDDTNVRVPLTLQARENMLSVDDASFESSAGTWVNQYGLDGTSGRVAFASALNGGYVYKIKSGATDFNYLRTGVTTYIVNALTVYSASIAFRPVTNARTVRTEIWWYNAAGTQIGSSVGGNVTSVSGQWTRTYVTGTAPSGTVYAAVAAVVVAAPLLEEHYIDTATLVPGFINILTANQSSWETDTSGFSIYGPGGTPTYLRVEDLTAPHGSFIAKIAIAANTGNQGIYTATAPTTFFSGQIYSITVWAKASTTGKNLCLITSGGVESGSATFNLTTSWAKYTYTFTAGATSTTTLIYIYSTSNNFDLCLDALSLINGSYTEFVPAPAWTRGGLLTAQRFEIERSVAGGLWTVFKTFPYDVTTTDISDALQSIVIYDYFAEPNKKVSYRIRSVATTGSNILKSDWSLILTNIQLTKLTKARLKSLTDPTTYNLKINNWQGAQRSQPVKKQRNLLQFIGQKEPIVVSGPQRYKEIPFSFYCATQAELDGIIALLDRNETMLLQEVKNQTIVDLLSDYIVDDWKKDNVYDLVDAVISGTFVQVRGSV